jgi:surfactin synthase thioesterase subunit
MLPAAIQVCPIELPGRGRRRDEPPVNDVAVLADQLADALPLQVSPQCMWPAVSKCQHAWYGTDR